MMGSSDGRAADVLVSQNHFIWKSIDSSPLLGINFENTQCVVACLQCYSMDSAIILNVSPFFSHVVSHGEFG